MKSSILIIVTCLSLVAAATAINDCSLSLKSRILTCENVQLAENAEKPISAQLTNDTVVFILKNSLDFHLQPQFHTEEFHKLNSYQIISVRELKISPESFSALPTLEYVKICDNEYNTVLPNTFNGLGHLKTLNLNNNSIHEVNVGAFTGLTSLETLELTHNDFTTLRALLFSSLANLKSLFLYHNNIEVLQEGCLDGLESLNVLDLTYNRIVTIDVSMLNGLTALSQLYLSYNRIDQIQGDFRLKSLEFLYLQNNKLTVLSQSLFANLENLRDIDLSRNRINELSPLAFYGCQRLMNINYKENNLKKRVEFEFADNTTSPLITA